MERYCWNAPCRDVRFSIEERNEQNFWKRFGRWKGMVFYMAEKVKNVIHPKGDFFDLKRNHTNVRTEIVAGLTTFFTMAYIIFVNPQVLGDAGMDTGASYVGNLYFRSYWHCTDWSFV